MLKKLVFKVAKGSFMGRVVGTAFRYCSWAIPVKKVYNSKEIIAFYHPKPSYENHLIISPKRAVKNLQQMALDNSGQYFVRIWEAAKDISRRYPEYYDSFVLVANGGKRQEVSQVHFHMFTNHEIVNEYFAGEQVENVFYSDKDICILKHPNLNWEVHFVIRPGSSSQMAGDEEYKTVYFRSILRSIDLLDAEFRIVQRGYSFVYQCDKRESNMGCPVFHIVSGRNLK